ncbi:Abortive infection bacteriophage resistance protein [Mycoplasmopsis maculosa]|uniref:Abortive infection bacteriophage resistance protein n=1 Tax=Mycoplasmopsis maculosa TaxID=114885 RepID=A0A449B3S0_9BACT|nr:Abi family protein [Mycoplasmopsis maculosa]VEU75215.1 Abortive infection bacteriophage resistance protein [Mycoplasmopsis maculosa]
MNKNNVKSLLSFEEQLNFLQSKYINWNNQEKFRFKIYLINYGYSHMVYKWKSFLTHKDRKNGWYFLKNVKSSNLIDLFNCDRTIGNLILSNIQNIEIKFQNAILSSIQLYINSLNIDKELKIELKATQIFKWKINSLFYIFKKIESNKNKQKFKDFINSLKNNFIKKSFKKIKDLHFWEIIRSTTFGQLIELFNYLNNDIKSLVAIHFEKIINNLCINYYELTSLMKIFKKIRNIICHNDILLNYELRTANKKDYDYKNIITFTKTNKINLSISKNIKLSDIVKIISFFNDYNNKENKIDKESLNDIFLKKVNLFINEDKFDSNVLENIKNKLF